MINDCYVHLLEVDMNDWSHRHLFTREVSHFCIRLPYYGIRKEITAKYVMQLIDACMTSPAFTVFCMRELLVCILKNYLTSAKSDLQVIRVSRG